MLRAVLVAVACAACAAKTSFVEELGPENYDAFLKKARAEKQWVPRTPSPSNDDAASPLRDAVIARYEVLLEFYAPWCGHCKRMAPILDEFAEAHVSVRVGKVDATKHSALAKSHGVDGYPTLRWRDAIRGSPFREFRGGRDLDSLERLDLRLNAPAISHVGTAEELGNLCSLKPGVAFVAAEGRLSKGDLDIFEAIAAHRHYEASFAVGSAQVFGDAALPESASGVALLQPGEPPLLFEHGAQAAEGEAPNETKQPPRLDQKALDQWVKKHNAPLYSYLGPSNFRALGKMRKVVVAVVADPDPESRNFTGLSATLYAAARAAPAPTHEAFGFGELDGDRWGDYVKTMGVRPQDLPRLLVIDVGKDRYWSTAYFHPYGRGGGGGGDRKKPDADLTAEAILDFLDRLDAGTLKPHYNGWRGFRDRVLALHPAVIAAYAGSSVALVAGLVWYLKAYLWDEATHVKTA